MRHDETPRRGEHVRVVESDDREMAAEGQEGVIDFVEERREGVFISVLGLGKNPDVRKRFLWRAS